MARTRLVSAKDFFILRIAFVIIVFWLAVWNLVEEGIERLSNEYGIPKWKCHLGLLLITVAFILLDPDIFEKV